MRLIVLVVGLGFPGIDSEREKDRDYANENDWIWDSFQNSALFRNGKLDGEMAD